ncbi:MAG: TlpA family protein disulfide reductase [Gammaproteobacteria bacterium]|nr:TlpA family protein disulfide reductase [Gammaproteobacteria bacterium]
MKKILLFCFTALLVWLASAQASALLDRLSSPLPAPTLDIPDLQKNIWKTADLKGQPAIVNFWATWCPPCREEMPSMEKAWEKIKDEGIQMLAVSYGEDADRVEAFQMDYPMSFPVLLDTSGEVGRNWPVKGLPTTFVIDSEGNIVYQALGAREWDDDELLDMVRELKK